jgi:hypothetical protein
MVSLERDDPPSLGPSLGRRGSGGVFDRRGDILAVGTKDGGSGTFDRNAFRFGR